MLKIPAMIVAVAGVCVLALWWVPPADPVDYIQFQLTHRADATVGVTEAEAAKICPPDMTEYHAACVDHLVHPHFATWQSRTRFLAEVQAIPDEDCAHMAATLIEHFHETGDGAIVKNARGGFNCDFTRYGLKHLVRPMGPGKYQCEIGPGVDLVSPPLSAADYDVCVRDTYVTRPVYNLSHTRYSIVFGYRAAAHRCFYTRLRRWRIDDQWQPERCELIWEF